VLGVMYRKSETLKKLDHVVVTKLEFDRVIVWNEYINANQAKKLKTLKPPEKGLKIEVPKDVKKDDKKH
jgi:hypothetical protein